jgi:hypothetical protein
MKKVFLPVVIISVAVFTTVMSCKKATTTPPVTPVASLNSQFIGLRYAPQAFSIPVGIDTTVFGAEGTLLRFYPNSFKDANGTILNSGTVNLLLTEILTPGDMINNRVTTMMATGEILQSCGQITVDAKIGGQEVYANRYAVGFKLHDSSSLPMSLFYAATSATDSMIIWTQTDVAYIHGTRQISTTEVINDTLRTVVDTCYFFDNFNNFTSINCNWFAMSVGPKADVSVVLPDGSFNATNTELYLVLPKINAGWAGSAVLSNIGKLGQYDSSYVPATNTLMLKTVGSMPIAPVGQNYELVTIANKGGNYYYWSTAGVVPSNGIHVSANMVALTRDSISALLKGL